jgi:hypothetical protein
MLLGIIVFESKFNFYQHISKFADQIIQIYIFKRFLLMIIIKLKEDKIFS